MTFAYFALVWLLAGVGLQVVGECALLRKGPTTYTTHKWTIWTTVTYTMGNDSCGIGGSVATASSTRIIVVRGELFLIT